MSKLVLANEGVFPVVKDKNGNPLSDQPKTGLLMPGTIQGEGKLAGVPSLFIRLSSCNLRCIWQMEDGSYCRCDTTYASFHPDQTIEMEVDEIVQWLKHNMGSVKHVVVTGGEPLLQKKPLALLCQKIKEELNLHITIESNGTLFDSEVAQWVDLFSISPKLRNSEPNSEKLASYNLKDAGPFKFHADKRRNIGALQSYIDICNQSDKELQLKFVIGKTEDYKEIQSEYLDQLADYHSNDILLMPLGATREEIAKSAPMVLEMSIANGWRYSPRVHIDLFGSKSGV
ncbi:7-carboxy-7-deazaguanine synthase QueE [Carboxylicivirga caseinilyticus]|uniref:7-carboxy-7-deazaguanine synthase QueE n=1 Tax=Carboxylicivirga caseinilyticus TaxID=3417572 RepID=UPI003D354363|nr:7-carboxy-7-deazaguanine synthase QueE [Marinilabiliaceae bacterium A049]